MELPERIGHAYFFAKHHVINKGYANEIDLQEEINLKYLTKEVFLNEIAWVILASGMNDKIVRKIFPLIKKVMFNFNSAELITEQRDRCYKLAIKHFNHSGKINAILYIASYLSITHIDDIKLSLSTDAITFIQTFPYMGKATSFHFAKNIGIDVVKPDRHLIRISNALGFKDPNDLCILISKKVEEKISLIDLVIWRYATLDKNYLKNIGRFIINPVN